VKIITRNKFVDRLKRHLRHAEKETLPWDEETARATAVADGTEEPGEQQRILEGIYVEGKTYQEVSDATGIPLGTLKRRLRTGLAALRMRLAGAWEDG
jgi:RNA polymerase sigma-70 factor (ECF subfamily)